MTNPSGPHFILSGYRYGTSSDSQGTLGRYWSSSAYTSATNAHLLNLNGTNSIVLPADSGDKRLGRALRCLAQ